MAFRKGDKNINRQGRPPGVQNKSTEEIRQMLGLIIEENLPRIREAIKEMKTEKLINTIDKLLRHYMPRQREHEVKMDLEALSQEDLEYMTELLFKKSMDGTNSEGQKRN